MPIAQKQYPMRFTPKGLTDAFDATDKFPGACIQLANLVFDQANPEIMVSRPGVVKITDFTGFATPGVVSLQTTIGDLTYGLIATARNAGKDEPFVYNNATGAFVVVGNVTNANSPTSQATTGAWTPPTIANVGIYVIVTHPGFPGGGTKFGWFDITNPAAPVWNGGDTTANALPSVPVSVANFNNRAYFACGNTTPYTDVLSINRTAGTQVLTVGDASLITALSGLPIQTTSSGVAQALLVFKSFQIWQITGDPAGTSTLSLNYLSLTTGSSSPRSIVQSPLGVYFAGAAGPYIVDNLGVVRTVTHSGQELEPDVHVPWENALTPTRIAGGFTGTIYRTCMETVVRGTQATNDYWFDEHKRRWSGPHTFSFDCASQYGQYFILASNANPGALYKSEIEASINTVYTDDGTTIVSTLQSSTFPKTGHMVVKQVVESTIELASNGTPASYQITGIDDQFNTLNTCQVPVLPPGSLWGSAVWGSFSWASSVNIPHVYTVPWTLPLVFKKMALYVIASATAQLSLGTFYARYQEAGYTNTPTP